MPDIHFLDYRRKPIEQLVARCRKQHGMILNHIMGTGKTYSGALFMANFSSRYQYLVIGPKSTEGEWTRTTAEVNKVKNLQFLPLEEDILLKFTAQPKFSKPSGFIVIVDEAHRLVNILTKQSIPVAQRQALNKWFDGCKKLLLLTGTPFTTSPVDISYIVNLAAGKLIVPTSFKEFQDKYYVLNKKKAVIAGWVAPFSLYAADGLKYIVGLFAMTAIIQLVLQNLVQPETSKMSSNLSNFLKSVIYNAMRNISYFLQSQYTGQNKNKNTAGHFINDDQLLLLKALESDKTNEKALIEKAIQDSIIQEEKDLKILKTVKEIQDAKIEDRKAVIDYINTEGIPEYWKGNLLIYELRRPTDKSDFNKKYWNVVIGYSQNPMTTDQIILANKTFELDRQYKKKDFEIYHMDEELKKQTLLLRSTTDALRSEYYGREKNINAMIEDNYKKITEIRENYDSEFKKKSDEDQTNFTKLLFTKATEDEKQVVVKELSTTLDQLRKDIDNKINEETKILEEENDKNKKKVDELIYELNQKLQELEDQAPIHVAIKKAKADFDSKRDKLVADAITNKTIECAPQLQIIRTRIEQDRSFLYLNEANQSRIFQQDNWNNKLITVIDKADMSPAQKKGLHVLLRFVNKLTQLIENLTYSKLLLFLILLTVMRLFLTKLREMKSFYTLNTNAIAVDILPYISVYNPFLDNSDQAMRSHFPVQVQKIRYTFLRKEQLLLLYKVMLNKLSDADIMELGLVESVDDLKLFRARTDGDFYTQSGRIVSNIGSSQKFDEIFAMHRASKQATLVYSNFPGGLKNFMAAAVTNQFTAKELPSDDAILKQQLIADALAGTIDFLCLPHYATEGIDVPGMRLFHILEPCTDIISYKQLLARVVRYQHDMKEPYTVNIITWVAKMPKLPTKMRVFLKFWVEFGFHKAPWLFSKDIPHIESPDEMVSIQLREAAKNFDKLQIDVMELTQQSETVGKELTCCVYNPNQPCEKESCRLVYDRDVQ